MNSRLLCICDLLERCGQPFGDRLVSFCSATPEAGFERGKGGRGYKDVERVQVGCFDLPDALDRLFSGLAVSEGRGALDN